MADGAVPEGKGRQGKCLMGCFVLDACVEKSGGVGVGSGSDAGCGGVRAGLRGGGAPFWRIDGEKSGSVAGLSGRGAEKSGAGAGPRGGVAGLGGIDGEKSGIDAGLSGGVGVERGLGAGWGADCGSEWGVLGVRGVGGGMETFGGSGAPLPGPPPRAGEGDKRGRQAGAGVSVCRVRRLP